MRRSVYTGKGISVLCVALWGGFSFWMGNGHQWPYSLYISLFWLITGASAKCLLRTILDWIIEHEVI